MPRYEQVQCPFCAGKFTLRHRTAKLIEHVAKMPFGDETEYFECGACGSREVDEDEPYCPHCGAYLDGREVNGYEPV